MFQFHEENSVCVRSFESSDELLAELGYNLCGELQILDLYQLEPFCYMRQR
jgi:hypothetical protein